MEPETLRSYVSENRELEKQLTKRNQQYIFDLKNLWRQLIFLKKKKLSHYMRCLPILVQEQKGGKTARQLFGTVSERTEAIITKPVEQKESGPFLMWLDNTLLILGIFWINARRDGGIYKRSSTALRIVDPLLNGHVSWLGFLLNV